MLLCWTGLPTAIGLLEAFDIPRRVRVYNAPAAEDDRRRMRWIDKLRDEKQPGSGAVRDRASPIRRPAATGIGRLRGVDVCSTGPVDADPAGSRPWASRPWTQRRIGCMTTNAEAGPVTGRSVLSRRRSPGSRRTLARLVAAIESEGQRE